MALVSFTGNANKTETQLAVVNLAWQKVLAHILMGILRCDCHKIFWLIEGGGVEESRTCCRLLLQAKHDVMAHLGLTLSLCTISLWQTVVLGINIGRIVICGFFSQLILLSVSV